MEEYGGQTVAVLDERIIASDVDPEKVRAQVEESYAYACPAVVQIPEA